MFLSTFYFDFDIYLFIFVFLYLCSGKDNAEKKDNNRARSPAPSEPHVGARAGKMRSPSREFKSIQYNGTFALPHTLPHASTHR